MPKQVTRFQCDHCKKKTYASKYAAITHEKQCFFNPEVKSCITCNNASEKDIGDCDIRSWCYETNKEIFRKHCAVKHCPYWQAIKIVFNPEHDGLYF